jgi:DNA (cytosine-5)-methyltransferase 1
MIYLINDYNVKVKRIMSMKFIDLFAGIGGFRIALEEGGSKCVYSSEWDKFAQITYKHNFNDLPEGDITQINPQSIPEHDILCGGFPCQAFSISGKQGGFDDTRGTLFFDVANIVKFKKPKVLFLENVRNFVRHDGGRTLNTIKNVLDKLGYDVFTSVLNSSNFGVPQHRQRVYIVCFNKDLNVTNFKFPSPTYKEIYLKDILEKNVDTKDYEINRTDMVIKGNEKLLTDDLVAGKKLRPIRVGTISKGGQGERIYSPEGHAITLSAYGGGIAGKTGAYLINRKVRQLTKRECLRVQGFPESFSFPDEITRAQVYKMCGNSVSVPVVSKIFKQVVSYLL